MSKQFIMDCSLFVCVLPAILKTTFRAEDSPKRATSYIMQNYTAALYHQSFMKFNSPRHGWKEEPRQMAFKEDKSLNAVNVWGALAIHPRSLLHSLSVWPYPTCMTPDHSSSLCTSITPVTSSFHFSGPRPELPSPVTDDTISVDYLGYHEEYMVKYPLAEVIIC